MTRLIKVTDQASSPVYAKPALAPVQVPLPPEVLARQKVEQALAAAAARQQALTEELERLRSDHAKACDEAYAKGFKEGQSAATQSYDKQVEAFELAGSRAASALESELKALHDLSVDIALTALGQIVSDPEGRRETIQDTVSRMVATLSKTQVCSIAVSALDFPDPSTREALLEIGRRYGLTVKFEDGPTGTCTAHLPLGTIDLALSTQFSRLADVIEGWKP